jgi:uncharacterized repeat protein (TIGR01451 family)
MTTRIDRLAVTTVLALTLQSAWSQEPLQSRMDAYLVQTDPQGEEQLVPAESASPGDTIEYRLTYENTGPGPLSGLAVVGPIPEGTRYLGGSASTEVPHEFQVTIDGGETWQPEPVTRQVTGPDGTVREEVVPPREYDELRWRAQAPLEPDQVQVYVYRVSVEEEAGP